MSTHFIQDFIELAKFEAKPLASFIVYKIIRSVVWYTARGSIDVPFFHGAFYLNEKECPFPQCVDGQGVAGQGSFQPAQGIYLPRLKKSGLSS
jgi:hypothetical protein